MASDLTTILPPCAVVVTHGPSKATRAAVARTKELVQPGGEVLVVAGTEPGEPAMTAVRKVATVVDGRGPAALVEALRRCPPGAVLVVHDDVLVLSGSVEQMYLAHLRTGQLAVPATNDAATDHHEPTVPADARRLREQETGGRLHERPVRRAALSCVVGSRDELLELAGRGGAAPALVHEGPAEGWVRARNAVAYHQSSCVSRLVPTDAPDDRPLLVAAMIVRDEARFLGDCLAALAGVVDRVEIADTGSVDDTVAIARQHGANVEEITWRDDFAWARNQVLERCGDAHYVLWLDADERFRCDDPAALRRILATYRDVYPVFGLEVRNLDDDSGVTSAFRANRIVRATGSHFVGAIHEQPAPVDPGERWPLMDLASCRIDHLGYASEVLAERDKHARNLEIAKRQPGGLTDPDAALNYLRSLDAAEQDPSVTLAALDELFPDVSVFEPGVQSYLLCMRADRLRSLGRFADALEVATDALGRVPADDQARYLVADLLHQLGRDGEVAAALAGLDELPSPAPAFEDLEARTRTREVLVRALVAAGDVRTAITEVAEGGFPWTFDPWPLVVAAAEGDVAVLREAAEVAGATEAPGFAVAAADRVSASAGAELRDVFLAAGGPVELAGPLDQLAVEYETVQGSDDLFAAHEQDPSPAAALAYARAAAAGQLDLSSELAWLEYADLDDARRLGAILGAAATAHVRRRDDERAARDIAAARAADPAAARAAAALARLELGAGSPGEAIEAVLPALSVDLPSGVDDSVRHELADLAAHGHASLGEVAQAIEVLLPALSDGAVITSWGPLARAAADDLDELTLLVGAALATDGHAFIDAVADNLRADQTAEVCVAYLYGGGTCPAAVSTGILAALMRNRLDVVELLCNFADLLDLTMRARLAERLAGAGRADLAEILRPAVEAV